MKQCTTCKTEKENSEFNKHCSRKDGLNNICKECSRVRSKKYYDDNGDHHREVIRSRMNILRTSNQKFIIELLKRSECKDCGNKDIRVMEFDHVRGIKSRDISQLIGGYSRKLLEEEIEKCEIVCANCHRIRTGERSPNYRTKSL